MLLAGIYFIVFSCFMETSEHYYLSNRMKQGLLKPLVPEYLRSRVICFMVEFMVNIIINVMV